MDDVNSQWVEHTVNHVNCRDLAAQSLSGGYGALEESENE